MRPGLRVRPPLLPGARAGSLWASLLGGGRSASTVYSSLSRLCLVSPGGTEPREPLQLPGGGEGARSARSLGGWRGGEEARGASRWPMHTCRWGRGQPCRESVEGARLSMLVPGGSWKKSEGSGACRGGDEKDGASRWPMHTGAGVWRGSCRESVEGTRLSVLALGRSWNKEEGSGSWRGGEEARGASRYPIHTGGGKCGGSCWGDSSSFSTSDVSGRKGKGSN